MEHKKEGYWVTNKNVMNVIRLMVLRYLLPEEFIQLREWLDNYIPKKEHLSEAKNMYEVLTTGIEEREK